MTDQERDALIRLFAAFTAGTMKEAKGQKLICQELGWNAEDYSTRSQHPEFAGQFSRLLTIRERVDLIARNYPNNVEAQYRKATALLKKYRRQNAWEDARVARRFIAQALAPAWDIATRTAFDEVADFLDAYKDYFLSYTNRQADQVNYDFRLAFETENKSLLKTHQQTANLLARQIVHHLHGLSGYYDKDKILGGDNIRHEILTGARSALVFVQVLSNGILENDGKTNWCFEEYSAYRTANPADPPSVQGRERKYRFLLAKESKPDVKRPAEVLVPLSDLHDSYLPWFKDMLELEVDVLERHPRQKLRSQVEGIGRQIANFRNTVLNKVVPDEFAPGLTY